MTRFLPLLLLGALLVPLAPPAAAQSCGTPYAVSWPDQLFPVWELEFLPPSQSTGRDGSGIEIRNVRYNGRLVMKRGHVPILNVKYESGCNCFRDWQDSEVRFIADNPVTSCVAESTPGTVATMCDVTPENCTGNSCSDVGSFTGVAIERFPDYFRLTTHMSAGWYRYTMRWEFHRDGTIRPFFGYTSTGTSCTTNPRRHHAYWRFDFDIDGPEDDYAVEISANEDDIIFETETQRSWGDGPEDGIAWQVLDTQTNRGYQVKPSGIDYDTPMNPGTGNPAIDNFAREDAVVARYASNQIDDGGGGCSANFTGGSNPIVNSENVYDTDIVLWYRSGVTKPDIDPGTCYETGPVLTPIGDWNANPPVAGEEGATPTGYTLEDAYPNPFDRTTTIRFSVETAQRVTLKLYDAVGREVRTLYEGTPAAGVTESVVMDGAALPSGVYTVRLEGESIVGSTRVVLLK